LTATGCHGGRKQGVRMQMKQNVPRFQIGSPRHISPWHGLTPSTGRTFSKRGSAGRKFGWMLAAAIATTLATGCGSSGLTGLSTAGASTGNLVDPSPTNPTGSPVATLPPTAVCTGTGLAPEDLSGQCRTLPTTMGALEANEGVLAAASFATAPNASPALRLNWQSLGDQASGYLVYVGSSTATANVLVSNL
jgi:hypothetical protein